MSIEPQIPFFEVDAKVQTKSKAGRYLLIGSYPRADGRQEVKARGWIGKNESMKVIWRKIDNPPIYAGETLKDLLRRRGIEVTGKVRVGKSPNRRFHFIPLSVAASAKSLMTSTNTPIISSQK